MTTPTETTSFELVDRDSDLGNTYRVIHDGQEVGRVQSPGHLGREWTARERPGARTSYHATRREAGAWLVKRSAR